MSDLLAYRASFCGAYQSIFSEPPYHERLFPAEAMAVLKRNLETPGNITLLLVMGNTKVLGFALGVPLASRHDIYKGMHGLLPVEHTYYLADMGVLPQYRDRGLGRLLNERRLDLIDRNVYSHAVVRESTANNIALGIFNKAGFEEIGVYQEVTARRTDGGVRSDRRMFLSKVL